MQKIWQYSRGDWEKLPWPIAQEQVGSERGYEELRRLGWAAHHVVGDDFEVWHREGAFLLLLHIDSDFMHPIMTVICTDFPSYLMFRKEFGSLFVNQPKPSGMRLVHQDCHPERSEGSRREILRYPQNDSPGG